LAVHLGIVPYLIDVVAAIGFAVAPAAIETDAAARANAARLLNALRM
jgi:hypothetical protein